MTQRRGELFDAGTAPGGLGTRPREGALDRPRGLLPTRVEDLPPLTAAYEAALQPGLDALARVGSPVSREALVQLDGHVRLLLAWTQAINLTAIREPGEVAIRHVLDSLAALPVLRARGIRRLLDIGSGGGFPGFPLAAALDAERALLVDSVGKKVRFLETVIAATGLERTVGAEQARVEALARDPRDRGAWPAVTARAVVSLAELVEIGLPLVAPGGVLIAWKGPSLDKELAAARPALRALAAGRVEIVEPRLPGLEDHRLVVVERGGPVDPRFPRDPAERRRPL
jgi:16S rRNA (guanine527-N7)-methyltransferase